MRFEITDLEDGTLVRYPLASNVSSLDGGSIQTYEADDGSKITQITKWDANVGVMRPTTTETLITDPGPLEAGDDTFADADGTPVSAGDLQLKYTWARPAGAPTPTPGG